jgi:dienelactone hydrolase
MDGAHGTHAGPGPGDRVRARHGAVAVPGREAPRDRILYRLFHPATFTGAEQERQTGTLPPDRGRAPWPVVILLNGVNVGPESYRWLAERLAPAGVATVTFSLVEELMPGEVGLGPGLDLSAMRAGEYGTRPSATAVGPLMEAVAAEAGSGPLAGCLDLDRVALGGHSAGGTVALLNARPEWFPGVRAAFSYGGHTMPAALFGHPEGTVLEAHPDVPALVMGGTEDAVMAASRVRYAGTELDPVAATFAAAACPGSALAVIEGAGHMAACHPPDPITARGFLEPPPPEQASAQRDLMARLVVAFLSEHLGVAGSGPSLAEVGTDPMLSGFRLR